MPWADRPPAAERIAVRRTRRRRRTAIVVVATFLVLVAAAFGAARLALELVPQRAAPRSNLCNVTVDGTTYSLRPVQAGNAATITAVGMVRGLPEQADVIAIATAMQESSLVNVDHGDLDSLGLFQQRPSQGWGTTEQIMDPIYATNAFFDVLTQIDGYTDMPVTDAAQKVQRSAFPDAYGQHEAMARAFAGSLTGRVPAALSCQLDDVTGTGDPATVVARLTRDFGTVQTTTTENASTQGTSAGGTVVTVDPAQVASTLGQSTDTMSWSIAQWAVANAAEFNIATVTAGSREWTRAGGWHAAEPPGATPSASSATTVAINLG